MHNKIIDMSEIELRKRLIEKIKITEDKKLLEEAYRLMEMDVEDPEIYRLNDDQKASVEESKAQIKDGKYLSDDKANNDIDEWLVK